MNYDLDYLFKVIVLFEQSDMKVSEIAENLERSEQFINNCIVHFQENEDYYRELFLIY